MSSLATLIPRLTTILLGRRPGVVGSDADEDVVAVVKERKMKRKIHRCARYGGWSLDHVWVCLLACSKLPCENKAAGQNNLKNSTARLYKIDMLFGGRSVFGIVDRSLRTASDIL